jgi:hypothetical protein
MALGALRKRHTHQPPVRLLLDWEGPGSRRWFVATTIGSDPNDEAFWAHREGVDLVRGLSVPYRRFQSRWDHVHGPNPEIGWEMAQAAEAVGQSPTWLNGHSAPFPPFEQVRWGSGLRSRQGAVLLQWLIEATLDADGAVVR